MHALQVIRTNTSLAKPAGILWHKLSPQKLAQIRVLQQLKERIERETGVKLPSGGRGLACCAARFSTRYQSYAAPGRAMYPSRVEVSVAGNRACKWQVAGPGLSAALGGKVPDNPTVRSLPAPMVVWAKLTTPPDRVLSRCSLSAVLQGRTRPCLPLRHVGGSSRAAGAGAAAVGAGGAGAAPDGGPGQGAGDRAATARVHRDALARQAERKECVVRCKSGC